MTDYKDTLNLPRKIDFQMKADLPKREPLIAKNWNEIYKKLRKDRKGQPKYILHDGPPYANGNIHLGHAINKVLKDFVVKSANLNAFDAPYIMGWDCHGLPIELNIEKKFGRAGEKISKLEFRQKCRHYAESQIELQKQDFFRLGIFADPENFYKTMDFTTEAHTIEAFFEIYKKGYIHQGFKPVYWCFDCKSSLAEGEIEYQDKLSKALDVRFEAKNSKQVAEIFNSQTTKPIYFVIYTTTAWTLPANQALSVNENYNYCLVEGDDECLVIQEDLVKSCLARYGKTYTEIATTTGKSLELLEAKHPFEDRMVKILLGDHVGRDMGTGIVHTAGAHGVDDFEVCKKYGFEPYNVIANGVYKSSVTTLAGTHIRVAEEKILELLDKKLIKAEEIKHSYPHCWRHKTPTVFLATEQYFINTKDIVEDTDTSKLEAINYLPDWGKKRMHNMLHGRSDWCISRQRQWGTPITLIINLESGEIHPKMDELLPTILEGIKKQGIDYWFELDLAALIGDEAKNYKKIEDILDVWFDSGSTHYTVLGDLEKFPDLQFPADVYLEGSDQYRGWFQSSLLVSLAINGEAPYKEIITHGFCVDKDGKKMSKSAGNGISPQEIITKYGSDILRIWIATADYTKEIVMSDEVIQLSVDLYRKIRNTAKFLLSNLDEDFSTSKLVPFEEMVVLDQWILSCACELQNKIKKSFTNHDFSDGLTLIHNFCINELGGIYLDIIKDRLYTIKRGTKANLSAQSAVYHLLHTLARCLMPICTFTAEEIYSHIPEVSESILEQTWYDKLDGLDINKTSLDELINLKTKVNKNLELAKQDGEISVFNEAKVILNDGVNLPEEMIKELKFFLKVAEVAIDKTATDIKIKKSSTTKKCPRCWVYDESVADESTLCQNCQANISGEGEKRKFF